MTHHRRPGVYVPHGADQQGRHRCTGRFVQAAEAANDLCADPDDSPDFRRSAWRALLGYLAICAAAVAVTALVIFGGHR